MYYNYKPAAFAVGANAAPLSERVLTAAAFFYRSGAGEGKPPLPALDIDITEDFSTTVRRLVAHFVVFR